MSNYTYAPVFMVFISLPSLCIPVIVGEISFQGNRKRVVFPYYVKKYKYNSFMPSNLLLGCTFV